MGHAHGKTYGAGMAVCVLHVSHDVWDMHGCKMYIAKGYMFHV